MTMTKLESVLPTHPKIQKFLEARNLDRIMVEEYLRHKDIDKLLASHRLWHTPRIPTFAGALELYRSRKLRTIKSESKRHHSGKYGTIVLLYCPQRKVSRGGATGRHGRGVFVEWKPLLWFVKNKRTRTEYVADFVFSESSGKIYHEWEQSEVAGDYYISHLTNIGDVVLDMMMGSGTTGISSCKCNRKFIGIEKDKRTFGIAKSRTSRGRL